MVEVNSVVASVVGAYLMTRSTDITIAIAVLALLLTGWLATLDR